MRIAFGCDEVGLPFLNMIREYLEEQDIPVQDFWVFTPDPVDYPDIVIQVAESIASGGL